MFNPSFWSDATRVNSPWDLDLTKSRRQKKSYVWVESQKLTGTQEFLSCLDPSQTALSYFLSGQNMNKYSKYTDHEIAFVKLCIRHSETAFTMMQETWCSNGVFPVCLSVWDVLVFRNDDFFDRSSSCEVAAEVFCQWLFLKRSCQLLCLQTGGSRTCRVTTSKTPAEWWHLMCMQHQQCRATSCCVTSQVYLKWCNLLSHLYTAWCQCL